MISGGWNQCKIGCHGEKNEKWWDYKYGFIYVKGCGAKDYWAKRFGLSFTELNSKLEKYKNTILCQFVQFTMILLLQHNCWENNTSLVKLIKPLFKTWGDHEASRQAPLGCVREVGVGSATIKIPFKRHPSGQSCEPRAPPTPDSFQHPVNTVRLGYLLFERCDKQWQPCTVNMWAHDCWICPENLSRLEAKCSLT